MSMLSTAREKILLENFHLEVTKYQPKFARRRMHGFKHNLKLITLESFNQHTGMCMSAIVEANLVICLKLSLQ